MPSRSENRRIAALRRAGYQAEQFPTRKDGKLTAVASRRLERVWDVAGPFVSGDDVHVYRPRSAIGRRKAAESLGLSMQQVRGWKAFPLPTLREAEGARVRLTKNGLRLDYTGGAIRRRHMVRLDPEALVMGKKGAAASLREVDRLERAAKRKGRRVSFAIRTGAGTWSPLRNGFDSPAAGLAYLLANYADADEWVGAIEVIELD